MLEYQWGNSSSISLSAEETVQDSDSNRPIFDPYTTQNFSAAADFVTPQFAAGAAGVAVQHHLSLPFHQPHAHGATHFADYYNSHVYCGPSSSFDSTALPAASVLSLEPYGRDGYAVVPKSEAAGGAGRVEFVNSEFNSAAGAGSRIGLNLGWRTYFASSENDFVNRLYRRSRVVDPGSTNSPRCQAEGCDSDLTHAKHYHRRHKVCEFHSKASTVVVAGLTQRFCQQCSRFHQLPEFDNGKRSCRKRLADHNRRRRKSGQKTNQESSTANKSQLAESVISGLSSSETLGATESPHDSEPRSSSVTVSFSPPPRISPDGGFGHKYFYSN